MENTYNFTIKEMLENGVHIGHIELNPKMTQYVFGKRNRIHIIDLEKTVKKLLAALDRIRKIASQNGKILIISSRERFKKIVQKAANDCGQYYSIEKWPGGMLTNRSTIEKSIKTMREYERLLEDENSKMTKKERIKLERKYDKLARRLGGIRNMSGLPDIVIVIGKENRVAIQEARKLRIPICAIGDTNFDPDGIRYLIPGNDDSVRSVSLYCKLFAQAALMGIQESLSGADIKLAHQNDDNDGDE